MTDKPVDIICIGETLIDFIGDQTGVPISETRDYHRYLGGSPTNVAMNLSRLGMRVELIATVGNDGFGEYILSRLEENKVNTRHIKKSNDSPTSVIFVNRTEDTPEFIPYRGADTMITSEQISERILKAAKIYHTTCFALSMQPARDSILNGARLAKKSGCLLSIDVNYSEKIWPNVDEAKRAIELYCSLNPMVKVSQDDVDRLFGKGMNHDQIFEHLHDLGAEIVCLTLGKKGAKLSEKGKPVIHFAALKVEKIMDATGAGDAFWSGFLFATLEGKSNEERLKTGLKMAAIKLQNVGRIPDFATELSNFLDF
jgi:fructokinase